MTAQSETDGALGWSRAGAALLAVTGLLHVAIGIAAIAGADGLAANVREIEEHPDFGSLYLSLTGWGWLLVVAGAIELSGGIAAWGPGPGRRIWALIAGYLGLLVAFFTLAILREAAVATIVLLLAALFTLSYLAGGRRRG